MSKASDFEKRWKRKHGDQQVISDADWDRIDTETRLAVTTQRPPGARTAAEYGEKHGLGRCAARRELERLIKQGVIEVAPARGVHGETFYVPVKNRNGHQAHK